jgi:hypothetical protein
MDRKGMAGCFVGVAALVLIVLKMTDGVDWSWWWVLAPLWIGWAGFLLMLLFGAAAGVLGGRKSKGRSGDKRRPEEFDNDIM